MWDMQPRIQDLAKGGGGGGGGGGGRGDGFTGGGGTLTMNACEARGGYGERQLVPEGGISYEWGGGGGGRPPKLILDPGLVICVYVCVMCAYVCVVCISVSGARVCLCVRARQPN